MNWSRQVRRAAALWLLLVAAAAAPKPREGPEVLVVSDLLVPEFPALRPAKDQPVYYVILGGAERTLGDPIGEGTMPVGDETDPVVFYDAVVHADGGDVVLMPGEPTALTIDGAVWRVTVTAAYRGDAQGSRCGASDLLEVEALRTDAAVDEQPLTRPTAPREAFAFCG